MSTDTVELLKECNSGIKMGVSAIDEVIDKVKSPDLLHILSSNKEEHQKLGSETHKLLNESNEDCGEPNPIAKSMSWFKTNIKLSVNETDNTVADLITDGCNMGVKSLSRYLNKYKAADEKSKRIAKDLVDLEKKLTDDIREYL